VSLGPVADWSWATAMTNGKGGTLKEIWVRRVTDLHDARVPIFLTTLTGSDAAHRHQVQWPPGVTVRTELELRGRDWFGPKFSIARGEAVCLYDDGTYRKYEGREMPLMFPGADLKPRQGKPDA
jgi:hypothetical protein